MNYSDIVEVAIHKQEVLLKISTITSRKCENFLDLFKVLKIPDIDEWTSFIWNYKSFIRSGEDPMTRWKYFECLENGVFSLKKQEKLIKSRLNTGEHYSGEEPIIF